MQINKNRITPMYALLFCCILGTITSCSTTSEVRQSMKNTDDAINSATKKLDGSQTKSNNNFNYEMDSIYISNTPVKRKETEFLPPIFQNQIQMDNSFNSMRQIADTLNRVTSYPVLLNIENEKDFWVRVTQNKGNLVDLLNNISAKTDTSWSYKDGKIVIADLQTKTFTIPSLPGSVDVSNQVNSTNGMQSQTNGNSSAGSGSSSGGGGSSSASGDQNTIQKVKFDVTTNIWTNLDNTIKSMLSKSGKIMIMPSTSSLTVTDKPSVIMAVDEFIKTQTEMLKKQVQIDVQVISVETSASDNYGINWNLMLKGYNASFSINGQPGAGTSAPVDASLIPVFVPNSTTQSFTIGANTGDLSGSQMVINALSTNNKTSNVMTASGWTINNQPVPIQVVTQEAYVQSVQTTLVAQTGSQQSAIAGQVNYGFTLNILPNIQDNGIINLQFSLNLSSLKEMKQIAIIGGSMQLPNMVQRNTMQKVTMRSGDTYVLTGFDSDFNSLMNNGVGGASNWLLGGGVSAQKSRSKLVILITPRIVKI